VKGPSVVNHEPWGSVKGGHCVGHLRQHVPLKSPIVTATLHDTVIFVVCAVCLILSEPLKG
jgi:hypothetical protein